METFAPPLASAFQRTPLTHSTLLCATFFDQPPCCNKTHRPPLQSSVFWGAQVNLPSFLNVSLSFGCPVRFQLERPSVSCSSSIRFCKPGSLPRTSIQLHVDETLGNPLTAGEAFPTFIISCRSLYRQRPIDTFLPKALLTANISSPVFETLCCDGSDSEDQSLKITDSLQIGINSYRRCGPWVCFGGGKRPRTPRVWKTRQRRGTVSKSEKLLKLVNGLSDVKEEVYGALDAFIAWELEFPLIAVKKALKTLKLQKDWKRIIQISKWMLNKGQGTTLGTYSLLLEALDIEGRVAEAEEIWQKIFEKNLEYVPRDMFFRVISMYERHGMHHKLLEVFADMEELGVRPNMASVKIVAETYEKLGIVEKCEKVLKKYPPPAWEYHYSKGKRIRVRYQETAEDGLDFSKENDDMRIVSGGNDSDLDDGSSLDGDSAVDASDDESHYDSDLEDVALLGLDQSPEEQIKKLVINATQSL